MLQLQLIHKVQIMETIEIYKLMYIFFASPFFVPKIGGIKLLSKPKPVPVHVNSTGKKKYKMQELIHSSAGYVFIPLNGRLKTDLFNKGYVDGRKLSVVLEQSYEDCAGVSEVLAFSSTEFSHKINNRELIGNIPLNRTFLLFCHEVERFTKSVCQDCEYYGTPDCFRNEFRCAEDDRDKYREDSWFSLQREAKKERKRLAFP